ncbi:MAG: UDP-N-acetylmuramate dehydrogenase [Candidatus Adiutrix sp.]|nr:UDP-N-acetylmuramate dehydrogenase [Candidatus Adiutrix sp.]
MTEVWAELQGQMGQRLISGALMKDYTTFGVGGPARLLARPETLAELAALLEICGRQGFRYYVLGGGSNTLFLKDGFDGVVIRLGQSFRAIESLGDGRLKAGAAAPVGPLLDLAVDLGLAGLEGLAGIPGTVGGALVMNAGSFGQSVGSTVTGLSYLDRQGRLVNIPAANLEFSYRRLKGLPEGAVIVAAEFALTPGRKESLREIISQRLARRAERHPLGARSAGSVFKNPAETPAGRIIEECGFKGARAGGAVVSEKHANFIVNQDGLADGDDIYELILTIIKGVRQLRGLTLEPEIKIIGREGEVANHGQN